jgi:hypothetical protein
VGRARWHVELARQRGGDPITGSWRPPMRRLASLYLPTFPPTGSGGGQRRRRDQSSPSLLGEGDHPEGGGGAGAQARGDFFKQTNRTLCVRPLHRFAVPSPGNPGEEHKEERYR